MRRSYFSPESQEGRVRVQHSDEWADSRLHFDTNILKMQITALLFRGSGVGEKVLLPTLFIQ